MLLRERASERRHRNRVLDEPAEIGVMVGLRPGTPGESGQELLVAEDCPQHISQLRVADRGSQRLELRENLR